MLGPVPGSSLGDASVTRMLTSAFDDVALSTSSSFKQLQTSNYIDSSLLTEIGILVQPQHTMIRESPLESWLLLNETRRSLAL